MKKLFKLWDEHTVGFCRVLFIATIGAVFSRVFADILCCFLLIMWLITKTGYEKKWNDHPTEKGGVTDNNVGSKLKGGVPDAD